MLAEEERQRGGRGKEPTFAVDNAKPRRRLPRFPWPPPENGIGKGVNNVILRHPLLSSYRAPFINQGAKRVEWPPPPDQQDFIVEQPVYSKGPEFGGDFSSSLPRQAPRAWEPVQSPQPYQPPPQQAYQQSPEPYQAYQPYQPPPFEPPPTTIALRPEPPISQQPAPVFTSQPAATRAAAPNMRGDEKWPPVEVKVRAQAENEARVALARGPAVRPRKVKRDYSKFFAQNALTPNYPSYKAPPGTQHYVEEGTSNF